MTLRATPCIICGVPTLVVIGVLLTFAATSAVAQYRLANLEESARATEARVDELRQAMADLRVMRRTVDRIEAKIDKRDESKP
jgi:hypothetical protein